MSIHFTYRITDNPPNESYMPKGWTKFAIYYYNGFENTIEWIGTPEQLDDLKRTYKETTGRDMKHYDWTHQAPVWIRIFGVLRPIPKGELEELIKKTLAAVDVYEAMYERFTHFKPMLQLPVRNEADKFSQIIGYVRPGQLYKVLDTKTVCDWHWAKIQNTGWVAIGDITGESYGERLTIR